jgi:hypothetical protein
VSEVFSPSRVSDLGTVLVAGRFCKRLRAWPRRLNCWRNPAMDCGSADLMNALTGMNR